MKTEVDQAREVGHWSIDKVWQEVARCARCVGLCRLVWYGTVLRCDALRFVEAVEVQDDDDMGSSRESGARPARQPIGKFSETWDSLQSSRYPYPSKQQVPLVAGRDAGCTKILSRTVSSVEESFASGSIHPTPIALPLVPGPRHSAQHQPATRDPEVGIPS